LYIELRRFDLYAKSYISFSSSTERERERESFARSPENRDDIPARSPATMIINSSHCFTHTHTHSADCISMDSEA